MKFTEGYWEKNERANAIHAAQAFNRLFRSKKKLRSLFPQTNSTHLTGGTSYEK